MALFPLFPLGMSFVSTGPAQLFAIVGTALSFELSILSLAADGRLRERAGSGQDGGEPPDDIGEH